ncbi:MAG: DUF3488 and transglutaminase-like domain-containing protein [Burkholderiaceae bacterium]|jgi:transglutaminase-like putative cysteine protease|nr:DUF3488 and transglutaminase-like domain-containing protein [Burkholderiaceae bacterium]
MLSLRNRLTRLPREARDTLFLLAVIAWVVLPHINRLPLWCSALAGCMLLWRCWLAIAGRPLPNRWWLVALLVAAVAATVMSHRTLIGSASGTTLIVALLALKTLEMRARRDAFVLFFLGFFAMLTHFLHSQSLPVATAMLLALLGLLTCLINAHRPVGQPSLLQSALLAGKMTLLGAPIMLALFILFPRFAPLWGLPNDALVGWSGLSSSMQVGNLAELALDEGIAFRIKFDGVPPAQRDLYFRGPVLSRFDGREWRMNDDVFILAQLRQKLAPDVQVQGTPVSYEVTLEVSNRPWLFVMDVAPESPQLPTGQSASLTADLQWLRGRPVTDVLRYRVTSYPDFRYGVAEHGRFDASAFLRLPAGFNPRTLELAAQMKRQHGDDAQALVGAALERLRTGGYGYTLEPGVYGRETADEFWFDTKAGFCEHIASAFVILMRAAGVPARIVTGYQGGDMNPVDNYWTVRQADAHAWAEVWLADRGWVRVDPTGAVAPGRTGQFQRLRAPDGLMAGAIANLSPTALAQLRALWEAANNHWNQWVLNYTQTRQLDLLRNLGFERPTWQDLLKLMAALIAAAGAIGVTWVMWERRQHNPWLRLLARTRHQLARSGIQVPLNAPPRALAEQVSAHTNLPEAARQSLAQWLLALERLRYAPPGAARENLATLQRQLVPIVRALRRAT